LFYWVIHLPSNGKNAASPEGPIPEFNQQAIGNPMISGGMASVVFIFGNTLRLSLLQVRAPGIRFAEKRGEESLPQMENQMHTDKTSGSANFLQ
jgi:hypothetical protein